MYTIYLGLSRINSLLAPDAAYAKCFAFNNFATSLFRYFAISLFATSLLTTSLLATSLLATSLLATSLPNTLATSKVPGNSLFYRT